MKPLQVVLVCGYLLIACFLFNSWFRSFKKDTTLAPEDKLLSIVTLIVATTLWPVVVPFAYLQLLRRKDEKLEDT